MEQHEVFGTLQEHIQRLIQTEKPTKIVPSPTSIASQKSVEKYRVAQKKSAIGSKEKQYQQQKQQPKVTIAKTDNSPSRETK
jgi:hypothetical protein